MTADRQNVLRLSSVLGIATACALAAAAPASAHTATSSESNVLGQWGAALPLLLGCVLAAALFSRGFARLRNRGRRDHAGWTHGAPFLFGLVVLVLALISPLDGLAQGGLLSAHMLQHVLIGDVAPALLVLGLRGPLAFFLVPGPILRAAAASARLRRTLAFVLRPAPSFAFWALTLAIWHIPAVFGAALARPWLHELEHGTFVLAGMLVWSQLLDPARRRQLDVRGRVLYVCALFVTAHLFIHPVLFSGRPVYDAHGTAGERAFGLSALEDQHWAGLVMTVEQVATLGTFLLLLLRPRLVGTFLARDGGARPRRRVQVTP